MKCIFCNLENKVKNNKIEKTSENENNLKDLNSHLPEWTKVLVELYESDLKYKIKRKS